MPEIILSLIHYCVKDYCGLLFNYKYTFMNECFFFFFMDIWDLSCLVDCAKFNLNILFQVIFVHRIQKS